MIIEPLQKGARDDQKASTKSPIDSVDITYGHIRPASWDRDLLKGASMEGAKMLDASFFVLGDLEETHIQPDQRRVVCESSTFL
jgi:hypothetical protein